MAERFMMSRLVALPLLAAFCIDAAMGLEMPGLGKDATATSPWEKEYLIPVYGKAVARFRPVDYKFEAALFTLSLVYIFVHYAGKARNRSIAEAFVKHAQPLLEDEFAYVAKEEDAQDHNTSVGEGRVRLVWNGGAEGMAYASGRRGVDGLQILFKLHPYHDVFEFAYSAVMGIATSAPSLVSEETISLTFRLPYVSQDNISGVFAVVDKTQLRASRRGRFDMTFTKVLDSENANEQRQLDNRYAIMSEAGELTDALLGEVGERGNAQRHRIGLQAALNGPAGKYLFSIVLSDQPEKRPEEGAIPVEKRERRLVVTMRVPRSASEARESLPLIEAACNIVDALDLSHAKLNNTTMAKLRNVRAQVDKDLEEEANRDKKEEEEEAKAEARRKAEKEKFDKLSPAEQEKRKQLEKKRAQKKAQGKAAKTR